MSLAQAASELSRSNSASWSPSLGQALHAWWGEGWGADSEMARSSHRAEGSWRTVGPFPHLELGPQAPCLEAAVTVVYMALK